MKRIARQLGARPRMLAAVAAGMVAPLVLTGTPTLVTRALLGWNVGVWLYLVLLQSVLSFVFNTTVLAFTVNIAASLI